MRQKDVGVKVRENRNEESGGNALATKQSGSSDWQMDGRHATLAAEGSRRNAETGGRFLLEFWIWFQFQPESPEV